MNKYDSSTFRSLIFQASAVKFVLVCGMFAYVNLSVTNENQNKF